MTDANKTVDWAGIERDYCTTTRSIREIAGWFSISEGAIRKRAKAKGWVRSKSVKGTQQNAGAYHGEVLPPARTEITKVEEVIGRGRNLADRLLDELAAETLHHGELETIIEMSEEDPARQQALKQAVSLPTRAKTLQTIALALKTMGETASEAPKGKKAAQKSAAEASTSPGGKFAPRPGPPQLSVVGK
ncbi:hypothetical protein [Devosia sp. 2618]|uniref:hypothetical protein n=1 Tax=Devosia sp. 2618 TaxID=3156454 RepID=UPI00339B48E2